MMNKENFKELIRYGINGVLTTAVNYVVCIFCCCNAMSII